MSRAFPGIPHQDEGALAPAMQSAQQLDHKRNSFVRVRDESPGHHDLIAGRQALPSDVTHGVRICPATPVGFKVPGAGAVRGAEGPRTGRVSPRAEGVHTLPCHAAQPTVPCKLFPR